MTQKKFVEIVEQSLKPCRLNDAMHLWWWIVVLVSAFVLSTASVIVFFLRFYGDNVWRLLVVFVAILVPMSIIELAWRIAIAHRDVEMKKLDVIKEAVVLFREDAWQRYEDILCCANRVNNDARSEKHVEGGRR